MFATWRICTCGAMTHPAAKGERFLATSGESLWLADIAAVLKANLGAAGARVSTQTLPNLLIRSMALTNPALKGVAPLLGANLNASGDKARRLLGWTPRSREEAILAAAESLLRLGLVKA